MSEMIERVARAMAVAFEANEDEFASCDDLVDACLGGDFDLYNIARAAIEAMREPTDEMLRASFRANTDPEIKLHKQRWQAMIDEALGGP